MSTDCREFLICYNNEPLVLIKDTGLKTPSDLLAWYAKKCDFDLGKLTWCVVSVVSRHEPTEPAAYSETAALAAIDRVKAVGSLHAEAADVDIVLAHVAALTAKLKEHRDNLVLTSAILSVLKDDYDQLNQAEHNLRQQNEKLRLAVANGPCPCIYCDLPKAEWAKCRSGFPGCGRADDSAMCPHFASALSEQMLLEVIEPLTALLQVGYFVRLEATAGDVIVDTNGDRSHVSRLVTALLSLRPPVEPCSPKDKTDDDEQ